MTDTPPGERLRPIGDVCELLREEFEDISISKIRYLELQGLVGPRRTRGGYRMFSDTDVERLRSILRLQRDEFLPLRVIRERLEMPAAARAHHRAPRLRADDAEVSLAELCDQAGIDAELARRLEEYDLLQPRIAHGERLYRGADVEIAAACGRIARHGLDARHLRAFRTAAGRQSALLEQLVATGLRSRDPDRRRAAMSELEELAAVATELAQMLLLRDLREAADR